MLAISVMEIFSGLFNFPSSAVVSFGDSVFSDVSDDSVFSGVGARLLKIWLDIKNIPANRQIKIIKNPEILRWRGI